MELNSISKLKKVSTNSSGGVSNNISLADIDYDTDSEDEGSYSQKPPHFDSRSKCFELDPCQGHGKICLVYPDAKSANSDQQQRTEIWFLDRSLNWSFICKSFTTYYRLMLIHLGLPFWHYSFTPMGLPQKAKQWFNLYAPVRLQLNEDYFTNNNSNNDESLVSTTSSASSGPRTKVDFSRIFKGKSSDRKHKSAGGNQSNGQVGGNKKKTATSSAQNAAAAAASRSVPSLRTNRSSRPWM